MSSGEIDFLLSVLVIVGGIAIYFALLSRLKNAFSLTRIISSTSPGELEALIAVVFIAALGVAAIQFIKSGGLKRLLEAIGAQPIEIQGRRTTIAAAANNHEFIAHLLRQAVETKLLSLDSRALAAENIPNTSANAAKDVAQMLRDALATRMRQQGI
ncbi:MAG: hypothetical protein ABJC13_17235 [Acidobacteriota bacterium]